MSEKLKTALLKKIKLKIPSEWQIIETIDLHTGGEPLRVITGGLPDLEGKTILEKRRYFRDHLDHIRTGLMWEPRGHADMYGAILTEPVSPGVDFGTFFLHNEGYSTMCGHAIIALVKLVIETGLIKKEGNNPELLIDTPAGLVSAKAIIYNGKVRQVSFRNVPSFVLVKNQKVIIEEYGIIPFSIAFGGAFYAITDAESLGIRLNPENINLLIDLGGKIKKAVKANFKVAHPFEEDLSFLYGTIFTGPPENRSNHSRNICIFAEGEVDRSATGTGVSARAALHYFDNDLPLNAEITIESILGTTMNVSVTEETMFGKFRAIIPEVSGSAEFTGQHRFFFDPDDKLKEGFIFR